MIGLRRYNSQLSFDFNIQQMQNSSKKIIDEDNDFDCDDLEGNFNRKISELSDLHLKYTYSNASSTSQNGLYEQNSAMEFEEPKFIKDDELYEEIIGKTVEAKNMLFIEDIDLSLYIFQQYQWSLQKMIEYFSDDWHDFKARMQTYDPEVVGKVGQEGLCVICCSHTQLYSSGMCEHQYCRTCWQGYITNSLQAGQIFFGCMNETPCHQAPVLKLFVRNLIPQLRLLYRRKICINYSVQNKDLSYCPSEKCIYFCIKPTLVELQLVKCPCGELYCFRCQQEPHAPAICRDVRRWQEILNSQSINSIWIKNNTRECPKCKQAIEKKVGCSHMKCILCQSQFCYECNQFWNMEHQRAKSECPSRNLLKKRRKLSERLTDLGDQLDQLMKEKERHEASLRFCEAMVKEETIQNKVIDVKVEVISAWMALKWTKILLAMQNGKSIERQVQKDFIESIRNTMEPVEHIKRNINVLGIRDLRHDWEAVQFRKQILKKNKKVWMQAFSAHSPNAKCLSFSI